MLQICIPIWNVLWHSVNEAKQLSQTQIKRNPTQFLGEKKVNNCSITEQWICEVNLYYYISRFLFRKMNDEYKELVAILKGWLEKQPHLPQNIDENNLTKFLSACNNSVEQTKSLIDICFTLRSQAPEIFANRDPKSVEIQNAFDIVDCLPLPKLTTEKYKLFIYRLRDTNIEKYVYADTLKAFFMVADLRMYTDYEETKGEIAIFDMAGSSLKHLAKMNLSVLKKYMTYTQEGHPARLQASHMVNIPPFFDRCMAMVRPFMKSEVAKLIHYHTPNSTTLHDFIPKELLPIEYGGTLCSVDELAALWRQKIMDNRDFFLDGSRWDVDESKRPANSNKKNIHGVEGSFRSLSID